MPLEPVESEQLTERDAVVIAQRLCRETVTDASFCAGGGNNRVYRVETDSGRFALKLYGAVASNGPARLGHEYDGLRFLGDCGIQTVPGALAIDRSECAALYEWIEGVRVPEHGVSDIRQVLQFMSSLRDAGRRPGATALTAATEAVFAVSDLLEQLQLRLGRLQAVTADEPQLDEFMRSELLPGLEACKVRLARLDVQKVLAHEQRTLSPSDFGFHNALRRPDGSLCFIDFEYFGWDDPVKLVADFLFHPAMDLDRAERTEFFEGVVRLYGDDERFMPRLELCFPLYGIRWVLIILNEFVPALWARRAFSGKGADWEAAKRVQLQKARAKMTAIKQYSEGQFIP